MCERAIRERNRSGSVEEPGESRADVVCHGIVLGDCAHLAV